jgi:hypothetical protein
MPVLRQIPKSSGQGQTKEVISGYTDLTIQLYLVRE